MMSSLEKTNTLADQYDKKIMPDPIPPKWSTITLPDTVADSIDAKTPIGLFKFLKRILSKSRQRVILPEQLMGKDEIPKYILQEFHNLPNGNYSKKISHGYTKGFDHSMLGTIQKARNYMASQIQGAKSVIDVGCASGKTAATVKKLGATDVWGIDPSPYLLQHASVLYPDIKFIHGIGESMPFGDNRFDAITCCFLFHEIPPRYAKEILKEFYRVLKPGGKLCICEPSPEQMAKISLWKLWRKHGWQGPYFHLLAGFVFEPFIEAWHNTDQKLWLKEHGFHITSFEDKYPMRHILATCEKS